MSYLGIDIGTTGSKAVVFDKNGKILSQASVQYELRSERVGWYELDSFEVIELCKKIIAQASGEVKYEDPVCAIGITSQGEAFTLLDRDDNYLSNAMVSFDIRSKDQVERICREFGKKELYNITGHSAHTLFSIFKLVWIKDNQPKIFNKAHRMLCFGDLLRYELTGNSMISYNLAARTMLFDVSKKVWSEKVLNFVDISKDMLSKPVASGVSAGTIKGIIAEELGLGKDVIVSTGGHDQCCGSLGVGVDGAGMAAYSLGTVECITPSFEDCVLNDTMMNSNLATYPYTFGDFYTTVGFCITGGSGLKWFIDYLCSCEKKICLENNDNVYEHIFGEMPNNPSNLFVLPHFTSTGTPYFDPSPLGAILGVTLDTSKGDLLKGILEGISFEMKLNLELLKESGIEINHLRAFGGGSRNEKWMQIKADIFGINIDCVEASEAGCMGAAMLAFKAVDGSKNIKECIKDWVKISKTYEPNDERNRLYCEKYGVYKGLYENLGSIRKEINKINSN